MFEEKIKNISDTLISYPKKKFYTLTYKKHKREIYFQNNSRAIDFIKIKFNSPVNKTIYHLIRLNLLKPFLKKIYLSEGLGDVIFVANQIKCFNLKKNIVSSFNNEGSNESFIRSKKFQLKMSKCGFGPKIIEIDEDTPSSKEELLEQYRGKDHITSFKKLLNFYKWEGIEKISIKMYTNNLSRITGKRSTLDKEIRFILGKLSKNKGKLLVTTIHGDFAKEQILIKGNSHVFIDWEPRKELIVSDLMNFFATDEKLGKTELLKDRHFLKLLSLYPISVRKNLKLYIILNDISSIIERRGHYDIFMKRFNDLSCEILK